MPYYRKISEAAPGGIYSQLYGGPVFRGAGTGNHQDAPTRSNHNEMYQVAVSYGKGSDEYNRIIRMIAARFPGDRIANNNAAIVAWETGDYDAMRVYLKRLKR